MSAASNPPKRALGKGLSALLPTRGGAAPPAESGLLSLPIEKIEPNPVQPRSVFQPDRLNELAQSIRENGIIQPLVVRRQGGHFQLIAGERRWRAARLAGLTHVPAVVQDFAEDRLMEIALVENIQREDLNPIEVAQAFERLNKQFKLSHEQIAQRTGKDRSTVTNLLRLLKLPGDIQVMLAEHRLSMGHARALLGLEDPENQIEVAGRIASEGLSVRQVERLVQRMNEPRDPKPAAEAALDPNVRAAIQELERTLGTRVRIVTKSDQRGRIEIDYYSLEDLTRIYETIVGK
ncbi:MAG: ParB/RepB/Spo0J family partition protein [Bryobacteraceae bacterium]|nr:ParB/RepB/Spo0J family partition protein [Bryobacteraceae bacterium]